MEPRVIEPSEEFKKGAIVADDQPYQRAAADPEAYWAEWAQQLDWYKPWEKVLAWSSPHAKWFVGGQLNACYNCVDRHVKNGLRNRAAIIWEGEPGDRRTLTYWDLYREINRFANVLKAHGIERGDRVAIYMPMIPELPIAMLACAGIGAVHSVVFGGFSAQALAEHINDSQAKALITADGGYQRGTIMITTLPGIGKMKPGSAGLPFPGVEASIRTEDSEVLDTGAGYLAITRPWPAMLRGIYGDPERYVEQYWSKWDQSTYFTSDGAKRDADGHFALLGRVDDVLSVLGHRIGTMAIESALVDHQSVAEAAVVGCADEIKGTAIVAFVTLKLDTELSVDLEGVLKEHVARKIGAIARPQRIIFSGDLPKTRSGKIMRRLLRDIGDGRILGDTTTLADTSVVEALQRQYEEQEEA